MTFGTLLRSYCSKAGISSLTKLGEKLQARGFHYENSILSRWQTDARTPRDRMLLLALAWIFIEHNAIKNIREINVLLESAGQGYITKTEQGSLHHFFSRKNLAQ